MSEPILCRMAAKRQRHLLFEAAVAGGIPIIRAVREGLAGDRLQRVLGVLNGTCNYMLTRMEAGRVSFGDALREAQERGVRRGGSGPRRRAAATRRRSSAILSAVGSAASGRRGDSAAFHTTGRAGGLQLRAAARLHDSPGIASRGGAGRHGRRHRLRAARCSCRRRPRSRAPRESRTWSSSTAGTAARPRFAGSAPAATDRGGDCLRSRGIARSGVAAPRSWRPPAAARVEPDFEAPQYLRFVIVDRPGIIASLAGGLLAARTQHRFGTAGAGLAQVGTAFRRDPRACSSRAVQAGAGGDRGVRLPCPATGLDADSATWRTQFMSYLTGLRCSLCQARFRPRRCTSATSASGPLEVTYDRDALRRARLAERIASRAPNLWRYREFLPIDGEPRTV